MRVSSTLHIFAICLGVVAGDDIPTGELGNATVITNNPVGATIIGTLPSEPFFTTGSLDGNIKGFLAVQSKSNGIGVTYRVKFSNFPKEGGPFIYHIHDKAVPEDGNCTLTEAHLDPTLRGETPACEHKFPQTCQVGDLSGKYGNITSDPFEQRFHDEFSSLNVGSNSSIPDRSFVIHFANKTRITCANFVVDTNYSGHRPTSTLTGDGVATDTPTGPVTAAANALNAKVLLPSFAAAPLAALLFLV